MMDFNLASQYVTALTGSPTSIIDWRLIHDQRKDIPAHHYRGTLQEVWQTLCNYNSNGYGVFCNINALDGNGRELINVAYIRAHVLDLDDPITAQSSYDRANSCEPLPSFAVQTSPGKYHVYWCVEPYIGNDFYSLHQRKFLQLYGGDKKVTDAARVMRVPGFYHLKNQPHLVNYWPLMNYGRLLNSGVLQQYLSNINVFDNHTARFPLGEPAMSAPSLDWLRFGMSRMNPNDLDRNEWLSFSAAIKQSGWLHTDEETLKNMWLEWCAQYSKNDTGENIKLWNSIRETEVGWTAIERRTDTGAYRMFGFKEAPQPRQNNNSTPVTDSTTIQTNDITIDSEILDANDCKIWFKDCYFIERTGEIFSPAGRFMNATKFNGKYGGKHFIITSTGKTTDEAWKAALRSTCWVIPKVDHVRFLPDQPTFSIIVDALGRKGLNTYIKARIDTMQNDVTIWLNHVEKILPNPTDRKILYDYLAHIVKYPGYKIPWSPMLQSAEGVGKTVFFDVMQHALGDMYVYRPKAPELVKSGSTFNAWMRGKLLIIVDEIKIDERRELIEILKPMITDARVEIQSKGVDQEMEDNTANWLFFSNYKDAIPINQNGRRYSIFYSAIQNKTDLKAAGMDDLYFNTLWSWLRDKGGLQAITYWLLNYPIERGSLPVRAPETSSYEEALKLSRSPMEIIISDCITDGVAGFRGGYISMLKVIDYCKQSGMRTPSTAAIINCLQGMGYYSIGKALRPYMQEHVTNKADVFINNDSLLIENYGRAQGYE